MARWIKADGTEKKVTPFGKKWTLSELQEKVGGHIETMPSIKPIRMVMNDMAALKSSPINMTATDIVRVALKGKPLRYSPVIRGDVLVLEKGELM